MTDFRDQSVPAANRWKFTAIALVTKTIFVAIVIFAKTMFMGPWDYNWAIFLPVVVTALFLDFLIIFGMGARLRVLRFRPAGWVCRLFGVPDDFRPVWRGQNKS